MERWEDPEYRACYQEIFEGRWEDHDPWNADHRSDAKTDLYMNGSKSRSADRHPDQHPDRPQADHDVSQCRAPRFAHSRAG